MTPDAYAHPVRMRPWEWACDAPPDVRPGRRAFYAAVAGGCRYAAADAAWVAARLSALLFRRLETDNVFLRLPPTNGAAAIARDWATGRRACWTVCDVPRELYGRAAPLRCAADLIAWVHAVVLFEPFDAYAHALARWVGIIPGVRVARVPARGAVNHGNPRS